MDEFEAEKYADRRTCPVSVKENGLTCVALNWVSYNEDGDLSH